MRAPAFWRRPEPTLTARMLSPLGSVYGALTLRRMRQPGRKAALPVICIGNFTVGGSGKTPTAVAVAGRLAAMGERPAFLSRGYGGSVRAATLVDPAEHTAAEVGDEPLLLGRTTPTIVSPDRVAGAELAASLGATVLVMDDGLQNPSLRKDLTIAVVDGAVRFGNGLVFPAGPLRAPAGPQCAFVDMVLVIGGRRDAGCSGAVCAGKPQLSAALRPSDGSRERLHGAKVIAMAGIGRPEKFVETLAGCHAHVVRQRFIGDHEPWSLDQLMAIAREAAELDAVVATTEKDVARIGKDMPDALAKRLLAVPVALQLEDPDDVLGCALRRIVGRP